MPSLSQQEISRLENQLCIRCNTTTNDLAIHLLVKLVEPLCGLCYEAEFGILSRGICPIPFDPEE